MFLIMCFFVPTFMVSDSRPYICYVSYGHFWLYDLVGNLSMIKLFGTVNSIKKTSLQLGKF